MEETMSLKGTEGVNHTEQVMPVSQNIGGFDIWGIKSDFGLGILPEEDRQFIQESAYDSGDGKAATENSPLIKPSKQSLVEVYVNDNIVSQISLKSIAKASDSGFYKLALFVKPNDKIKLALDFWDNKPRPYITIDMYMNAVPREIAIMRQCVVESEAILNKYLLVFGREDDAGHDACYVCRCLIAQSLFDYRTKAENSVKREA